jgi:hypothetical protein
MGVWGMKRIRLKRGRRRRTGMRSGGGKENGCMGGRGIIPNVSLRLAGWNDIKC